MDKTVSTTPLFKNKSFTKMFLAYAISVYGDWFDMLAISILVAYGWNSDPILIGLIPVCFALPGILFGSFAGVLADRSKKVNLMIISDWSSAVLTIFLVFADHIYWVLPILFIRSSLGLISTPAEQALTRHIVPEDQLLKATSYNQIVNNSGKIVGPLLGALILTVLSPKICILINAFSSLISGIILLTLRKIKENSNAPKNEQGTEKLSFKDSWKEGWAFVLKTRVIFNSILFSLIGIMCIQLVDFQFPVLLRSINMKDPMVFGLLLSTTGVGSIITITWMNRFKEIRYGWAIGGGMSLIGFGFAGVAFVTEEMSLLIPIFFALIVGFGNGIWMVSYNFALQKESPKEMVGRVFGITNSVMSAVFIIAPVTGGILVHTFGAVQVIQTVGFVVGGIGIIGAILEKWLWRKEELLPSKIEVVSAKGKTSV
ncbi:MFS transporter [Alkalihalobacillus sp. AL-G]|uniref:MFS transporter n=1 Tax=Alkalihalobacillus sp. AL-G TaxID=2926399 RepID=UPI00272A56CC|nr:MFS transporter [Alkalihalobacillus sp. AL-G]WLD94284.1 MFS transporter [Alkalihalobacillus sp. AL-G]